MGRRRPGRLVILGPFKVLPRGLGPGKRIPPRRLEKEGELTLPWVTTLTDPFQIMYHEVPLSPWLNTERRTH